jgi:hypothetical protein
LSAYTARRYPRELVDYMRGNGRKKVMFGTNYPMITPSKCLEHLDDLGLDDEAKSMFLRNPQHHWTRPNHPNLALLGSAAYNPCTKRT